MKKAISFLLLIFLSGLFPTTALFAQAQPGGDYRTRISVIPIMNASGESSFDPVCVIMTETIELVLGLLGIYSMVPGENLPPKAIADQGLTPDGKAAVDELKLDNLIFGSADRDAEGNIRFVLSVFDLGKDEIALTKEAAAESIFDIFDVADRITISLLEEFSSVHIGFGTISLTRTGGTGVYRIYLNDQAIVNPDTMLKRILNGTYTFSVRQRRVGGERDVFSRTITVYEGEDTRVEYSIPPASDEEFAFVDEKRKEFTALLKKNEDVEALIRLSAEFQSETAFVDYDENLRKEIDDLLKEMERGISETIIARMNDVDGIFYRKKRPDFERAHEMYQALSGLINDAYAVSTAGDNDQETGLFLPFQVRAGEQGEFFVADWREGIVRLSRFEADSSRSGSVDIGSIDTEADLGAMGIAPDGSVFYFDPPTASIHVFSPDLERKKRIPLPDEYSLFYRNCSFSLSPAGMIFIMDTGIAIVMDPEGNRAAAIEEALKAALSGEPVTDLFFDSRGSLYILSAPAGKVRKFSGLGEPVGDIRFEDLTRVTALAVDELGYFYFVNTDDHSVSVFNQAGQEITRYGSYGSEPGQLSRPAAVAVGPGNRFIVADTYNNRIQIYTAVSPPILLPEVSQLGMALGKRENAAARTIDSLGRLREDLASAGIGRMFLRGLLSGGILAGSLAGEAYLYEQAESNYELYLAETASPELVSEYRSLATGYYAASRLCDLAAFGGISLLSFSATNFILALSDRLTLVRATIGDIQSLSMDTEYEIDPEKYLSLRKAYNTAIGTGLVPPVLASILYVVSYGLDLSLFENVWLYTGIYGMTVIPPVFGHLRARTAHPGLLTAGLLSDALLAGHFLTEYYRHEDELADWTFPGIALNEWEAGDLPFLTESAYYGTLNDIYQRFVTMLPDYLLVGALMVRLAAGIYDTRNSWIAAQRYNTYKALRPVVPEVSLRVLPLLGPDGEVGLAVNIRK